MRAGAGGLGRSLQHVASRCDAGAARRWAATGAGAGAGGGAGGGRGAPQSPPTQATRKLPKPPPVGGAARRAVSKSAADEPPAAFSTASANPYAVFTERIKHWHMLAMCLGCGIAGVAAGQLVDVDEEETRRKLACPYDKDMVEHEFRKAFEFRPDLAATMVRYAFVRASERAVALGRLPPPCPAHTAVSATTGFDACRSARGLQDVEDVIATVQLAAPEASRADIAALGAIAAVRFLRGPADKITFRWGRLDPGQPDTRSTLDRLADSQDERRDPDKLARARSSAGSDSVAVVHRLLKVVPNLNLEEGIALMAAHSVGEFHEPVSGIASAQYNRISRHKFFLGVHYYQLLIDLSKDLQEAAFPPPPGPSRWQRFGRDKEAASSPPPPGATPTRPEMLEAGAEMVHPTSGKKMTRLALVTKDEADSIVRDPEAVEVAMSFATDPTMWAKDFASGFAKVIDADHENLRHYVSVTARRRAEEAKAAALRDLPPPAVTRSRDESTSTRKAE